MCVTLVLVIVRHVRTQREQERQAEAEKAQSERAAHNKQGNSHDDTKGFVYNLLV